MRADLLLKFLDGSVFFVVLIGMYVSYFLAYFSVLR